MQTSPGTSLYPHLLAPLKVGRSTLRHRMIMGSMHTRLDMEENGLHKMLDGLIVVAAEPAAQLARLALRDALSDEDSRKRLAAQAPLEDKLAVADFVILNDGAPGALLEKVAAVWAEIVAGAPRSKPAA